MKMMLVKWGCSETMGKKMMKEEMENSNVIMCQFWHSSWLERQKENKEEKKAQSNLHTMHAKHVITIP